MLFIEEDEAFFKSMDAQTREMAKAFGLSKGELCLEYEPFAKALKCSCERYEFVTFDYGDTEAREDFSLRVYDKHQVYPFFALTSLVEQNLRESKPFYELFQRSDITYDVNFTHLIDAFEKSGARVEMYATQMKALVEFGLIELLEILQKNVSDNVYTSEMNKVKILIDPSFMGERFKMVCFRA